MPRPTKWRKVCFMPRSTVFGPIGMNNRTEEITMTVDEYETIRLIDLESMTQEECAERMNVARTTVQRIYMIARRKLAKSLVEGHVLKIEGGDYKLCSESEILAGCGKPCKKRGNPNNNKNLT